MGPTVTPLRCQIVFVEPDASGVALDCVVTEAGTPFTVRVATIASTWMEAAVIALRRWADRGSPVWVTVKRRPDGTLLAFTDHVTSMLLDAVGPIPTEVA